MSASGLTQQDSLNNASLVKCRVCKSRGRWSSDRDGQDGRGAPMAAPQWNANSQMRRNNSESSYAEQWPAMNGPPPPFNAPQQQFVGFAQPPPQQFDASRMPPRFANMQGPYNTLPPQPSFGGGSARGGRWDNLDESSNRGGGGGGQQQNQGQRWGDRDRRGGDYGGGRGGSSGGGHWGGQNDSRMTAEDWAKPLPRNERIEQ